MTHYDSLVSVVACIVEGEVKEGRWKKKQQQQTSHKDSLVLIVASVVDGEVEKATNES